jgi:hypothetical protein
VLIYASQTPHLKSYNFRIFRDGFYDGLIDIGSKYKWFICAILGWGSAEKQRPANSLEIDFDDARSEYPGSIHEAAQVTSS